jgi:hypothetical protein
MSTARTAIIRPGMTVVSGGMRSATGNAEIRLLSGTRMPRR